MKKKVVLMLLCGTLIGISGCSKDAPIDSDKVLEQIREENSKGQEQVSGVESETVNQTDSSEELKDSNTDLLNGSETMDIALSFGKGSVCKVKVPFDWLISGYGYNESGEKENTLLSGTTLEKEQGTLNLDKICIEYALASDKDTNIRYEVYSTESGDISFEKQNNPNGIEVEVNGNKGYVYKDERSASDGTTPLCMAVQINDTVVIVRYGGPLEELGLEGIADKLQGLLVFE